jgi:leucyl aminopeptidase (aminopeptidase T)
MKIEDRMKMFNDVFAPKSGEKVLFLVDVPHDNIKDNNTWKDRRKMVKEWYNTFIKMGEENDFSVDIKEFQATGRHNSPVPETLLEIAKTYHLVLAMTEYSMTSSLILLCRAQGSITRAASMPTIEKRMEQTALQADYTEVQHYAHSLERYLNKAHSAEILFSTGDRLVIDLRNRKAHADTGECKKPGQSINFPSGEACKVPYEAAPDEIDEFGESKTEGIMPVTDEKELMKFIIKNNKINEVIGNGRKAEQMRVFFSQDESHRNIAELGIGCNPKAVVTGNVLEDEKVGGLHIAYGMSTQLGGKVDSDMHQDICYPKGLPVEATTLTLYNQDGSKTDIIHNAKLRYDLLK